MSGICESRETSRAAFAKEQIVIICERSSTELNTLSGYGTVVVDRQLNHVVTRGDPGSPPGWEHRRRGRSMVCS